MSSPTYEGKGQPPATTGWFSGLTAWWNALTPKYVTNRSGVSSATVATGVRAALPSAAPTPSEPTGAPRPPVRT